MLRDFAADGGQKADKKSTGSKLAVESRRVGAANKGSAKPLYVSSILTRASNFSNRD